ncbi:MAG: aminoacyl-tRNA hydrolase [Candidatus Omnitrophica bacterium]|nr:aminoacyl-tRNA hydrolase [Candidatus Gastranaerophilales bacterium]MDD5070453.1 aminoacyl-tRNA hydrolase [Candidatus Omnitrophota bacterium]
MKIIFGLGNPGKKYVNNRHNVGFMVLEELALKCDCQFRRRLKLSSYIAETVIGEEKVVLALPYTFMNMSGIAVSACLKYYSLGLKDCLIVYDDVDLDFAVLRFRENGSWGGHRGMESIIERTQSKSISRLRVGIGRPLLKDEPLADYVLSDFSKTERSELKDLIQRAGCGLVDWVKEGTHYVMSAYNALRP